MSEPGKLADKIKIGVLAMQGDFDAHCKTVEDAGGYPFLVRTPQEIVSADGLILPGGESTTIGKLLVRYGLDKALKEAHSSGTPVYGTCAGMILLAKRIESGAERGGQTTLGLMDITVARNAFGRQVDSFESDILVPEIDEKEPFRAVFIRAPIITEAGPSVNILGCIQDKIVVARQGNLLVSAFHPELTNDGRMHRYFLNEIVRPSLTER